MSAPLPQQMAGPLTTDAASLRHARLALPPRLDWQPSLYTGARLQGLDSEAALLTAWQAFVREEIDPGAFGINHPPDACNLAKHWHRRCVQTW